MTPEQRAREQIDQLLQDCGWVVPDRGGANLGVGVGNVIVVTVTAIRGRVIFAAS